MIENDNIMWEQIFSDESIVKEDFVMISDGNRLTNGVSIVVYDGGMENEIVLEYHELKKALEHLQADRDSGVVNFTD